MAGRSRGTGNAFISGNARQNSYFIPRDGIDREVITSDICFYLGNDALVRPGTQDDANGRPVQGYYITAYRNLTSEMIADLKNDSARWAIERGRQQAAGTPDISFRVWANNHTRGPNSNPARHSDTRESIQRGSGNAYGVQSQQLYSHPRDYDNGRPRYPGSDAPGYSGSSRQSSEYAPQNAPSSNFPPNPYESMQPQQPYAHAQPNSSMDTRYGGSGGPGGGAVSTFGSGNQPIVSGSLAPEGYYPGSHYAVTPSQNMYSMDMSMDDAPIPRTRPEGAAPFSNSDLNTYGDYGNASGTSGRFGPKPPSGPGQAFPQPVDQYYGRGPTKPTNTGFGSVHDMAQQQTQPVQQYEEPAFPPPSPNTPGTVSASTNAQLSPSEASSGPRHDRERVSDRPDRTRDRDHEHPDRADRTERNRDNIRVPTPPNRTGLHSQAGGSSTHHQYIRRGG